MKKFNIYILLNIVFLSVSLKPVGKDDPSRKLERAKLKADRSYQSFSYTKSIKRYKKVLELRPSDSEATIRIADSYRRVNELEKAANWYENASKEGVLTDKTDQLNYAQTLISLKRYDEAEKWYTLHGESGKMAELVQNRKKALENMDVYYQDSMAYFVDITNFNTEQSDFGPAYMDKGIVFASARPSKGLFKPKYSWDNSNFLDMFYVENNENPKKIQRGINTRYHEGPAVFYNNDQKVVFTRNNYHKGKSGESKDGINKLKLFYAEKSENGKKWCPPVELSFNNDDYSVGHPTVSSDGNTLYFASDMPNGEGGSDIYKSVWQGDKWSTPENLGDHVNTPGNEFFPFVHNDEVLFYSSDGMPGLGGLDVFEVSLTGTENPRNIGYPINTSKDDFGMIISEDGRSGYLSSNRDNGVGHDDIYMFERYFYDMKVLLVDSKTNKPLIGEIESKYLNTENIIKKTSTGSEIIFRVLRGTELTLFGDKEGYESNTKIVKTLDYPKQMSEMLEVIIPITPGKEEDKEEEKLFTDVVIVENNKLETQVFTLGDDIDEFDGTYSGLKEKLSSEGINIGEVYTYRNIYYDFDKYNIRSDAEVELNEVVTLLKKHNSLNIELESHTDIRGSLGYNDILAKNRVISAEKYLVEKGIDKDRIITDSFGEKELFIDCKTNCDEIKHQTNRRTEIRLVKKK